MHLPKLCEFSFHFVRIETHLSKGQKLCTTRILHPTFSPEINNHPIKHISSPCGFNKLRQFKPVLHELLAIERRHLVIVMVMNLKINGNGNDTKDQW